MIQQFRHAQVYGVPVTTVYGDGPVGTVGTHDENLWYKGKHYTNLSLDELNAVNKVLAGSGRSAAAAWQQKLAPVIEQRKSELLQAQALAQQQAYLEQQKAYQAQMAEYQEQMNAYLDKMAETMATEEPAAEPLKAAAEVQSAARADTNRKQLLRKGLMSTMTRYGGNGQQQKLGA